MSSRMWFSRSNGICSSSRNDGRKRRTSFRCRSYSYKNILGLVCDPVAGLVEIPCAKRNIAGTVSALTTADMVMAGVTSHIPFDDSVEAMYRVGKQLPSCLRETALGGVAVTEAGLKLKEKYSDVQVVKIDISNII